MYVCTTFGSAIEINWKQFTMECIVHRYTCIILVHIALQTVLKSDLEEKSINIKLKWIEMNRNIIEMNQIKSNQIAKKKKTKINKEREKERKTLNFIYT